MGKAFSHFWAFVVAGLVFCFIVMVANLDNGGKAFHVAAWSTLGFVAAIIYAGVYRNPQGHSAGMENGAQFWTRRGE